MTLTRKGSVILAEAMINRPKVEFQLKGSGEYGCINKTDNRFITIQHFVPSRRNELNTKVLWRKTGEELEAGNPKLKYKTHLSDYLYQTLNPLIELASKENLTGNKQIDEILQTEKYQAYLQNPSIELTKYVNDNNQVVIHSDHTSYANHSRLKTHTKEELLELHEETRVKVLADDRAKVKRSYKYLQLINDRYGEYEAAMSIYNQDFDQLKQLWKWVIETDRLRVGTTDDDINKKIILPIEFRLQRLNYGGNIIREYVKMVADLNKSKQQAEDGDSNLIEYHVQL